MGLNADVVAPSRSADFYWEFVVFQVENNLYKLPAHTFQKSSEIFASMFELPQPNKGEREGLTDERPIVLHVESCHFDSLLSALFTDTRYVSYSEAGLVSKDDWLGVLKLANMWEMGNMRQLAISELSGLKPTLSDVDRIVFGKEYSVVDWVISGYKDMTMRSQVVTSADVQRLGVDACLQVWQVQLKAGQYSSGGYHGSALKRHLIDAFGPMVIDAYQRGVNLGDDERAQPPSF